MKQFDSYTSREMARLRLACKSSSLAFSRIAFVFKTNGTKFIVNEHHEKICNALDEVVSGKCNRLIINIAPRYGKTELVSKMFIAYGFALNPKSRFIHLSYSDDLVLDNSKEINELMRSDFYSTLFPDSVPENTAAKMWKTKAGGALYAVSSAGQVTGFGAGQVETELRGASLPNIEDGDIPTFEERFSGAIIVDDPLKPEDAFSDVTRERVNSRFDTTIRSRVNSRNTPIIIVMQRLHEQDLCGYLMQNEPDNWKVLSLPCLEYDEAGGEHALWPFKHTVEELHELERINPLVFDTQYMQNPRPLEGLMYREFRTYDTLPTGHYRIKCYTDTADTGADYLCSIVYAEYDDGTMYILDVLFTKKPMEYTEPETARMLTRNAVSSCIVESNNGGRGFRRNVEKNCRELGNHQTQFEDFTQSANKQVRIFTHSAEVNNLVFMPKGWDYKFRDFYQAITSYRKEGRNAHDDAPDALTGLVEHKDSRQTSRFSRT